MRSVTILNESACSIVIKDDDIRRPVWGGVDPGDSGR